MTTRQESIENAARLLKYRESASIRGYGSAYSDVFELAKAWTELAKLADDEE